jgi:hypothetical protein
VERPPLWVHGMSLKTARKFKLAVESRGESKFSVKPGKTAGEPTRCAEPRTVGKVPLSHASISSLHATWKPGWMVEVTNQALPCFLFPGWPCQTQTGIQTNPRA